MSLWNRIINTISGAESRRSCSWEMSHDASLYCFVDLMLKK